MAKAYWVSCYKRVTHPEKLTAYAKLATPVIEGGGGRFLARGVAAAAFEAGQVERTVIVEFDSMEQALAVHASPAYQAALEVLDGGALRDLRIVAGV